MFTLMVALGLSAMAFIAWLLDEQDYDVPTKTINYLLKAQLFVVPMLIIWCSWFAPMQVVEARQQPLVPLGPTKTTNKNIYIKVDTSNGITTYTYSVNNEQMSGSVQSGAADITLQLEDGPPQVIKQHKQLAAPWMAWLFGNETSYYVVILKAPRDSIHFVDPKDAPIDHFYSRP